MPSAMDTHNSMRHSGHFLSQLFEQVAECKFFVKIQVKQLAAQHVFIYSCEKSSTCAVSTPIYALDQAYETSTSALYGAEDVDIKFLASSRAMLICFLAFSVPVPR